MVRFRCSPAQYSRRVWTILVLVVSVLSLSYYFTRGNIQPLFHGMTSGYVTCSANRYASLSDAWF